MTETLYHRAMAIAEVVYNGEADNLDEQPLPHLQKIANSLTSEVEKAAALLHLVIADQELTLSDLREQGMPNEVVIAINLLTKKSDVDYFTYIAKIKNNEIARHVKRAALTYKVNVIEQQPTSAQDLILKEKYEKALEYLGKPLTS